MKTSKIKKIITIVGAICLVCIVFIITIIKCGNSSNTKTFSLEDFSDIVIGESTFDDIYRIVPDTHDFYITGNGGITEYPTEDGKYIRINYTGDKMTVSSIEITDEKCDMCE